MIDPFKEDSDRLNALVESLPENFWVGEYGGERDLTPGTYQSWALSLGHEVTENRICRTCGRGGTCVFHALWDALIASVVRELDRTHHISRRGPARHLCVCTDSVHSGSTCPTRQGNGCPREGESGKTFRERLMEKHRDELDQWMQLPDREPDLAHEDDAYLYGSHPSYRCYVSRHGDCEAGEGEPEDGCTCSCHGGPREVSCGALSDHDPHGTCWGNGPFRVDYRKAWLEGVCLCSSRTTIDGVLVHEMGCPAGMKPPTRMT